MLPDGSYVLNWGPVLWTHMRNCKLISTSLTNACTYTHSQTHTYKGMHPFPLRAIGTCQLHEYLRPVVAVVLGLINPSFPTPCTNRFSLLFSCCLLQLLWDAAVCTLCLHSEMGWREALQEVWNLWAHVGNNICVILMQVCLFVLCMYVCMYVCTWVTGRSVGGRGAEMLVSSPADQSRDALVVTKMMT